MILRLWTQIDQVKPIPLRVYVTSTPGLPIALRFEKMRRNTHQDIGIHEIVRETIGHGLSIYFRHDSAKTREWNRENYLSPDWSGDGNVRALVEIAVSLFIFAATVCHFVAGPRWNRRKRLNIVLDSDPNTVVSRPR